MSNLSERQRLWLTIGISILLTGGLVALILSDRDEIEQIEADIAGLDSRIRAADTEIAKIPAREEDVLVYRAVEERELRVLPTQQLIADFHDNLSTFIARAGLRFKELPESRPEASELAQGVYVTRSRVRADGTSASILRFMNMLESDPRLVAIKGFTLDAGQQRKPSSTDELLTLDVNDIEHSLNLLLETYYYAPPAKGPGRIPVPSAERRLQEPKLRHRVESFRPEKAATYVLSHSQSRRDPLVDPRRRELPADPEALQRQRDAEEETVTHLESMWLEVADLVEQERALISAGDVLRADGRRREIDEKVDEILAEVGRLEHVKGITLLEMIERMVVVKDRVLRQRSVRPDREAIVTRSVAKRVLEESKELFASAGYEELTRLGARWKEYLEDREIQAAAGPVLSQIKALVERGRNLRDWSKLHFEITGSIVDKSNPRRSRAMINGRSVTVGEVMRESDEAVIEEVTRSTVFFRFRGERIPVDVGVRSGRVKAGAATRSPRRGGASGALPTDGASASVR